LKLSYFGNQNKNNKPRYSGTPT